jgi:L-iditol 2-dehydrogenase
VRLDAKYAYILPTSISLSEATIIETLATIRHAQKRAGLLPNESVVILGQGTTGLLHTQLASLTGAEPVIGISRSQWKLDLATNMGADHVIEANIEDAVDEVLRLTNGLGADLVIDTSGAGTALKSGIDMLRPGGRFSAFSVSQELVSNFSTFPLYYKEVNIISSRALTAADMQPAIDLVATGKIKVSDLITETYPLKQVGEAFERYEQNPESILRILIESSK